ncbi:MAG: protein-glutamate O-methyltransferase CheR [Pseudomonadota bacterium]
MTSRDEVQIEDVEVNLLLTGVANVYGYDFRQYARSSLLRRVRAALRKEGVPTVSALQDRVLHDPACMLRFVEAISVHTTTMFRDADVYQSLRREVIPMLRTYPFVRIWVAGCSTGEEVYSLAIVLEEEGIYDRCRLYATDISDGVLFRARKGICVLSSMKEYTQAYMRAGGRRDFSNYYIADDRSAVMRTSLGRNVIFSQHNLVCDGPFNEFHLILCRNVMIYFGQDLRARVHELFHNSLSKFGVLGVGKKESTRFTPHESAYQEIVSGSRLYRRVA